MTTAPNAALDTAAAAAIGVTIPPAGRAGILPASYTYQVNAAAPSAARLEATAAWGAPAPAERAARLTKLPPRFSIGQGVVLRAAPNAYPVGRPHDVHGLIVKTIQICNFEHAPHVRLGCHPQAGLGYYEGCQDNFRLESEAAQ